MIKTEAKKLDCARQHVPTTPNNLERRWVLSRDKMTITKKQALAEKICKRCNFFRKPGRGNPEQCVYGLRPSLNYRNIPAGKCALNDDERMRKKN